MGTDLFAARQMNTDGSETGGRRPKGPTAFTLIELLVVVVIIAVLLSILVPALQRARELAGDARCAATMHQSLVAILSYRVDWRKGVQNYRPNCPYWGQGWPGGPSGPHANLQEDGTVGAGHGPHMWEEGRSWMNYWRGCLLAGDYAHVRLLGCPFTSYVGKTYNVDWLRSHNGGGVANHVETNGGGDSFRQSPAFVWYGPPAYNTGNVAVYAGGNLAGPTGSYKEIGPLLTCPQVWVRYVGTKWFEPSHRPYWRVDKSGSLTPLPYAANVGFSDGKVAFFSSRAGGQYVPE